MRVLVHDGGRHLRTYGFGRVALSIINGIRANGHTALLSCPYPKQESEQSLAFEADLYAQSQKAADVCIQVGQPRSSIEKHAIPLLFYTMFDTYTMPRNWESHFKKADRIIVPTEQNAKSLRDHGVKVDVLPLYDQTGLFKDRPDWREEGKEQFTFMFVGTFSYRKSTQELLEAFLKEFSSDEARLILICTESNPDNTFNYICDLQARYNKAMSIEVVTTGISDAWLNRYYNRADCFVSASKGEGWGYPMMEAALTGLPCIVPDKLASTEFLPNSSNFHVLSKLLRVEDIPENKTSNSFKASYLESDSSVIITEGNDLQKTMRHVHGLGRGVVRRLGLKNRAYLSKNYSTEKFNERLEATLRPFAPS